MTLNLKGNSEKSRAERGEKYEIVTEREAGSTAGVLSHSTAKSAVDTAVKLVLRNEHLSDQRTDISEHMLPPFSPFDVYYTAYFLQSQGITMDKL